MTTRSLLVDSGSWIFATRSVVPLAKKCISSSSFIFHKRKQTIKQTYKSGLLIGQEQAWLVVCHHAHCTKNTKISRIYDVALKVNQRPDQTSWTTCVHTFQCNNVIDWITAQHKSQIIILLNLSSVCHRSCSLFFLDPIHSLYLEFDLECLVWRWHQRRQRPPCIFLTVFTSRHHLRPFTIQIVCFVWSQCKRGGRENFRI